MTTTNDHEIVRAVFRAVDELNRAVSKANQQGFRVDLEITDTHLYGRPFPYLSFSVAVYKCMSGDTPNETKL